MTGRMAELGRGVDNLSLDRTTVVGLNHHERKFKASNEKIRLSGSKYHAAADGRYLPETSTHAIGIKPYSSQDT